MTDAERKELAELRSFAGDSLEVIKWLVDRQGFHHHITGIPPLVDAHLEGMKSAWDEILKLRTLTAFNRSKKHNAASFVGRRSHRGVQEQI